MMHLDVPHVIISINEPGCPPWPIYEGGGCNGVLRLFFNDIDVPRAEHTLMSEKDAEDIVRFVTESLSKVNMIIVHCHAGISRSAAVAAELSLWLNGDCGEFEDDPFIPNPWVRARMREAIERQGKV
jgi:predicted protein tyrosine phosphatase